MSYIKRFFDIYCKFISVDLIDTFENKRNIRIVNNAFVVFYAILSKNSSNEKKEKLLDNLEIIINSYILNKQNILNCNEFDFSNTFSLTKLQNTLDAYALSLKKYKHFFGNNSLFRQSLIECHNALSHILAGFKNSETSLNKNISKANNHFHRGVLDIYKTIIKDNYSKINKNKLIELRKKEFTSIGIDSNENTHTKDDIEKGYVDLVENI